MITTPTNALRCVLACVAVTMLFACKKEKNSTVGSTPAYIEPGNGVFIGNEGAFGSGNASVMYYRFGDAAASADLYAANNGQPLGDVLQSLFMDGSRLYMMVNNSQTIQSAQLPSFTNAVTITGLPSPRYMAKSDADVAFVTNYGSHELSRVSLSQHAVTGVIGLPDWSDAVLYANHKLYVTVPAKDKVYVCDPTSMQVTDSVQVGIGGNALVADKNGMLWVFAAGESWNNVSGALVKFNPNTDQVVGSFDLGLTQGSAGRLCANATGDTLYYLNGDVFRMSIDDAALPQPFIAAGSRSLYGLYRHPTRALLFVTDAKDFSQNGDVSMYSANGALQKTLPAGVAPSSVLAY